MIHLQHTPIAVAFACWNFSLFLRLKTTRYLSRDLTSLVSKVAVFCILGDYHLKGLFIFLLGLISYQSSYRAYIALGAPVYRLANRYSDERGRAGIIKNAITEKCVCVCVCVCVCGGGGG